MIRDLYWFYSCRDTIQEELTYYYHELRNEYTPLDIQDYLFNENFGQLLRLDKLPDNLV